MRLPFIIFAVSSLAGLLPAALLAQTPPAANTGAIENPKSKLQTIEGPGSTLSQQPRAALFAPPLPIVGANGKPDKRATRRPQRDNLPYGLPLLAQFGDMPRLRESRCVQDSSFDRSGGNGDSGHFVRKEGDRAVLADIRGPGCIYRFWSANAQGQLKIYFDGETSPRVNCPIQDFFTGKVAPFAAPLVGHKSGGWYSFFPMPFVKSCRIEVEKPGNLYYHVQYQLYPDNADIETFTTILSPEQQDALRTVAAQWNHLGDNPQPSSAKQTTVRASIAVAVNDSQTLANIRGAGQTTELRLRITPADRETLRQTVLRVYWDGAPNPAIESPVGDFFGVGFGDQRYKSLPAAMTDSGFVAYWPMPFGKSARFELVNRGKTALAGGEFAVTYAPLPKNARDLGYFHAQFHRQTTVSGEPFHILSVTGRGHYVGEHSDMQGDRGISFLEGDEKFYVDGETFPSIYGTGTEDFYTGGWYFDEGAFNLALHGATIKSDPLSRIAAYRWQIGDCVPFFNNLKVDIEHGGNNDYPGADYSCVAYWYQDKPAHDWSPVTDAVLTPAHFQVANSVEAESLNWQTRQISIVEDRTLPNGVEASGGQFAAIMGDNAAATIKVNADDVYRVRLGYIALPDQPDSIGLRISDAQLNQSQNAGTLSLPKTTMPQRADVSAVTHLAPGSHALAFSVPNGKRFLLDYVKLEPSRKEPNVMEAESVDPQAIGGTGGGGIDIVTGPDAYSGRRALQWKPKANAATLRLPLTVSADGDYDLEIALDRNQDTPRLSARIDDGPASPVLDPAQTGEALSQRVRFGTFPNLKAGAHTLTLINGGKERVLRDTVVTLDYYRLTRSRYANAVEAESLRVLDTKDGQAGTQNLASFGPHWSGDAQMFFQGTKPGAEVTLELPFLRPGTFTLGAAFTTAVDYGLVQALLDGREVGTPVDLYSPTVTFTGKTVLGTVTLTPGTHRLTFRAVGKNANATNYFIGVDAVTLDPK